MTRRLLVALPLIVTAPALAHCLRPENTLRPIENTVLLFGPLRSAADPAYQPIAYRNNAKA